MDNTIKKASKLFTIIRKSSKNNGAFGNILNRRNQENALKPESKAKKVAGGIGIAIAVIFVLAYMAIYSITLTESAINSNVFEELIYLFMGVAQLIILFLGSLVVINNLYFSKDNVLLATLPLTPKTIFLAKFASSYFSQLIISFAIYLPLILASGIYAKVTGYAIGAEYFIYCVINALFIPIVPLLLITILSFPIMYLVTLFKNRNVASVIAVILLFAFVVLIYVGFMTSMTSIGNTEDPNGNITMPTTMINMILIIKKVTIFNYLIINAMLGNQIFGFFVAHIAGLLLLLGITMLISSVFYRKGMLLTLENSQKNTKSKTKISYKSNKFTTSFVLKELKTIFGKPALIASPIMSIIMIPVFGFLFTRSQDMGIMNIGLLMYMSFIFISSSNIVSLIGFSLEGKNIYLLKTLPISIRDILVPKIIMASILNILVSLSASITIGIIAPGYGVLVGIVSFVVLMLGGIGSSCYGLYNDVKNPNLNYKNINELTKNNRRSIKPALVGVLLGVVYLALGILCEVLKLSIGLSVFIIFGTGAFMTIIYAIVGYNKLIKKAEDLYDILEV